MHSILISTFILISLIGYQMFEVNNVMHLHLS